MRLSIDATPLLLRSAGVKNYLYHWISHLRALAGSDSIATFPFSTSFGALDHERSVAGLGAKATGLAVLHFLNSSRLPWSARADVFHASNLLRNPPRGALLTATIHDMTCWLTPELHTASNVKATKWFGERIMTRADGLIAVSESSRQDAIRILRLPPQKVVVIHHGVPDSYFGVPSEAVNAARGKYGLARSYALFVGTIEPRKNLGGLLDAWAGLSGSLRQEFELVVAGPAGWGDRATLHRLRSGPPRVRYLGYVAEADLPGLTAGATAFLYPSLYEGFGFPVAQAMAAGVPVLTSNLSSLPEIASGAALLVDPRSVGEIRSGLERLLLSPALREDLGRIGSAQAQRYRWQVCAGKSLDFFRRLAG
ncbi:MAG: glycosyltransferase family 1 protein [Bryobacteraceae bacterium]|jgi:alpha-1,3-rhamnosyl/mannosyltransferase